MAAMLELVNIKKNFGAVQALKDASLRVNPGESRALLGSNGSGKSTLVKVLSGLIRKDGGTIRLNGREVNITSPAKSFRLGISMAYQDLSLISKLSVADNMVIGMEPGGIAGMIDKKAAAAYAEKTIEELKINARPDTVVSRMDLSNQSLVEVAKALYRKPQLLILDEITASMHSDQVQRLFEYLKNLCKQGLSILFVSHRFDEVYALCETATILREGEDVADVSLGEETEGGLVYHMTGKQMDSVSQEYYAPSSDEPLLRVEGLCVGREVQDVSMRIGKGEIVGIAGLQGQGQAEFLRALYGALPFQRGSVKLEGNELKVNSPYMAIRKGMGFISGDRERESIFTERSVAENIFIAHTAVQKLLALVTIKKQSQDAKTIIDQLNIIAAGTGVPANSLSGGNQQKLVVGRWLSMKPQVLLLDDPTKGVDVKARGEINHIIREMTKTGMSVLFSSSDNEELLRVADRIYVFYEGKIAKEFKKGEINGSLLAAAMLGAAQEVNPCG